MVVINAKHQAGAWKGEIHSTPFGALLSCIWESQGIYNDLQMRIVLKRTVGPSKCLADLALQNVSKSEPQKDLYCSITQSSCKMLYVLGAHIDNKSQSVYVMLHYSETHTQLGCVCDSC